MTVRTSPSTRIWTLSRLYMAEACASSRQAGSNGMSIAPEGAARTSTSSGLSWTGCWLESLSNHVIEPTGYLVSGLVPGNAISNLIGCSSGISRMMPSY